MLLLLIGAALFLGVIGIYGVLAYAVRQRTSELGVRIALGASPGNVVGMVVRQGALLAVVGIGAGLIAVALAASYVPARRAGRIDPVRALKAE